MAKFIFGDGEDINRDPDVSSDGNDTKGSNDEGSVDLGTALMNEILNSDKAKDFDKIFETDTVADGVNTNTSSDNQPKFINKPIPNPEYFKIGEAYHIHKNPGIPNPSIFGNYCNIPVGDWVSMMSDMSSIFGNCNDISGGDWVGLLTNISTSEFTFICYPVHPGDLRTIRVLFDDFGKGPGKTDIIRLSNILSNNSTCIPNIPTQNNSSVKTEVIINDPRVRILNKSIITRSLNSVGFTDGLILSLVRILSQHHLPITVGGLIAYMLRTDGRDSFIELSYGIGEKRMDEIIYTLKCLGIQIDGYSID